MRKRERNLIVLFILFIGGVVFITLGAFTSPETMLGALAQHILRDLGLAATISALFGIVYEYRLKPTLLEDVQASFRQVLKENEKDLQELEKIRAAGPGLRTFISYRRDESAGYAGRIADSFVEHFSEDRVFRDIDSIEPGLDFAEAIKSAVGSSDVLIAVIGKNWLTATDAASQKRLENPDDYVRLEIATALERNIRVIPLLLPGASMPSADELPDDMAPLARRHAFELHDSSWREEVQRLMTTLDKVARRSPVETTSQRQADLELEVERLRTALEYERTSNY